MKWDCLAILTTGLLVALPGPAIADPPLAEVRGHAIWSRSTGVDHQPIFESTSRHALP